MGQVLSEARWLASQLAHLITVWGTFATGGGTLGAHLFAGFVREGAEAARRGGIASPPMVSKTLAGAALVGGSGSPVSLCLSAMAVDKNSFLCYLVGEGFRGKAYAYAGVLLPGAVFWSGDVSWGVVKLVLALWVSISCWRIAMPVESSG